MSRNDTNEPIRPWRASGPPKRESSEKKLIVTRKDAIFALRLLLAVQILQETDPDEVDSGFPQFEANRIRDVLEHKLGLDMYHPLNMGFVVDEHGLHEEKPDSVDVETGRYFDGQLRALENSGAESDLIDLRQILWSYEYELGSDAQTILEAILSGKLTIYDVRKE